MAFLDARYEAVVLAGGRSRRMGREKATLIFDGRTLLERAVAQLSKRFRRVRVSVAAEGPSAELAETLQRMPGAAPELVQDLRAGRQGPLAAVEAVLTALEADGLDDTSGVFVFAVDGLYIDDGLLVRLLGSAGGDGSLGAVPRWRDRIQGTHAVYNRELRPVVSRLLDAGEKRLQALSAVEGVEVIEVSGESLARHPDDIFRSVNTPEDAARWGAADPGARDR